MHILNGDSHGVIVACYLQLGMGSSYMNGLDEREQVAVYRAVFIRQVDTCRFSPIDGGDMDLAVFQDPAGKGEPVRRIMIAADNQDGKIQPVERTEEVIQQMDRFPGGNGLIVNVSSNENAVRLFFPDDGKDLPENIFLIFQKGILV